MQSFWIIWLCKTTEIFICEIFLTTSGKTNLPIYTNGDTLLHVISAV
jgi:hypothetical protein